MAEEFPYPLFVEGKWDPKTPKLKNKLTIYFQSKKSNGGDCTVQHLEGQKATVGFKTEEGNTVGRFCDCYCVFNRVKVVLLDDMC